MHISRLPLVNYRNFERANVVFKKGVKTRWPGESSHCCDAQQ